MPVNRHSEGFYLINKYAKQKILPSEKGGGNRHAGAELGERKLFLSLSSTGTVNYA
jgi:hypothetical protein